MAIAASASFLTPVGYQTNMMVYGPGGYRYTDYARLGAPLTVIALVVTITMVRIDLGLNVSTRGHQPAGHARRGRCAAKNSVRRSTVSPATEPS